MSEWIISSSAFILIVIALRGLLKGKISLRLQYGLWALVLVRLLVPISIVDSAMSISNMAQPVIQQADSAVQSYENAYEEIVDRYEQQGVDVELLPENQLRQEAQMQVYSNTYNQIVREHEQQGEIIPEEVLQREAHQRVESISFGAMLRDVLPLVWYAGMAIMAAVLIGVNLHFGWKLRSSRVRVDIAGVPLEVYHSTLVATPCLFGLLKPAIYLTDEVLTDGRMQHHVLAHEMSHYRQKDHIWSLLRSVCLVLHWYNPLVWVAAVLSKRDAELACDEATIAALGESERVSYGKTLIDMTCVKRDPRSLLLTATTMLGSKKTLKERITLIAAKPKTALYTLISCVLVVSIAVGCTFTGAALDESDPAEPTQPPTTAATAPSTELSEPTTEPTDLATEPSTEPTEPVIPLLHFREDFADVKVYPYTAADIQSAQDVLTAALESYQNRDEVLSFDLRWMTFDPILTDHRICAQINDNPLEGWSEDDYYERWIELTVCFSAYHDHTMTPTPDYENQIATVRLERENADSPWTISQGYWTDSAYTSTTQMMQPVENWEYQGVTDENILAGYLIEENHFVLYTLNEASGTVNCLEFEDTPFIDPGTPRQSGRRLTLAELDEFSRLFNDIEENHYYNYALSPYYTAPEKYALHLFFNGGFADETEPITDAEIEFYNSVSEQGIWGDFHRLSADKVDAILDQYFGMTIDEFENTGLVYNPNTDCYYMCNSDTARYSFGGFIDGYFDENTGRVTLYYNHDQFTIGEERAVTLQSSGDGNYHIVSNTPALHDISNLISGRAGSPTWTNAAGTYSFAFREPYIREFSQDISDVMWDIDEKYGVTWDSAGNQILSGVRYEASLTGDILSILLTIDSGFDQDTYAVYNINVRTGQWLTDAQLIEQLGYTQAEYQRTLAAVVDAAFSEDYGDEIQAGNVHFELYTQQKAKNNSAENLALAQPFLDQNGVLTVAVPIYSLGGAGVYPELLPLEEYEPYSADIWYQADSVDDLVDTYEETITWVDTNGTEHTSSISMPVLLSASPEAIEMRERIIKSYMIERAEYLRRIREGYYTDAYFDSYTYTASLSHGILTIYTNMESDWTSFSGNIYNINAATGENLDDQEVLEIVMPTLQYVQLLRYADQIQSGVQDVFDLENFQVYLNENGTLMFRAGRQDFREMTLADIQSSVSSPESCYSWLFAIQPEEEYMYGQHVKLMLDVFFAEPDMFIRQLTQAQESLQNRVIDRILAELPRLYGIYSVDEFQQALKGVRTNLDAAAISDSVLAQREIVNRLLES